MPPTHKKALTDQFMCLIEDVISSGAFTADDVEDSLAELGYFVEKPPEPASVNVKDVLSPPELPLDAKLYPVKVDGKVVAYVPGDSPIPAKAVARAVNLVRDHPADKPPLEHYMKENHSAVWNDGAEPIFVTHPRRDVLEIYGNAYMSVQIRDTHRIRIEFDPNY